MDTVFFLSAAGTDKTNANPNNVIFNTKDQKFFVSIVTLSSKDNQKRLSKGFERSVY